MGMQAVLDLFVAALDAPGVETVEAALVGARKAHWGLTRAERIEMKIRCSAEWGVEPGVLEQYLLGTTKEKWIHDLSVHIMVLSLKHGVEAGER